MTTYKVTGNVPFDDHQPGDEYDADYDEDFEERALERGSISIVKGKPKTKREEAGSDA